MTKQIRVGYDGSAESQEAVLWSASEADARGDELHIVSCFSVPVVGEAMSGWVATEAYSLILHATESGLSEISKRVHEAFPKLTVTSEAAPESAAWVLLQESAAADMIVVGASRHDGAAAFWLGSTPRHLVRRAVCPVAVVRGAASRGRPDRIVVGVDGSPGADAALNWATAEAELHGAPLTVVHAWDYPYPDLVDASNATQTRDLVNIDAACVLEAAVESVRERSGVPVTHELVEGGTAYALISSVRDGDVLVLGSRGRGAITSGFFGSTVNAVLDAAAVPVVVVHEGKQ